MVSISPGITGSGKIECVMMGHIVSDNFAQLCHIVNNVITNIGNKTIE